MQKARFPMRLSMVFFTSPTFRADFHESSMPACLNSDNAGRSHSVGASIARTAPPETTLTAPVWFGPERASVRHLNFGFQREFSRDYFVARSLITIIGTTEGLI